MNLQNELDALKIAHNELGVRFAGLMENYSTLSEQYHKLRNLTELQKAFALKHNMDFLTYMCPIQGCDHYRFHEDRNNKLQTNCGTWEFCEGCESQKCGCHAVERGIYTKHGYFCPGCAKDYHSEA